MARVGVLPAPPGGRDTLVTPARRECLAYRAAGLVQDQGWRGVFVAVPSPSEDRADALGLEYRTGQAPVKVMDVTALAMDFAYTGRLTG